MYFDNSRIYNVPRRHIWFLAVDNFITVHQLTIEHRIILENVAVIELLKMSDVIEF